MLAVLTPTLPVRGVLVYHPDGVPAEPHREADEPLEARGIGQGEGLWRCQQV